MKGAPARLRSPDQRSVEQICGFQLPPDLAEFFQHAPFVEMTEFYLVEAGSSRRWSIGSFIPLTAKDYRGSKAISGVTGVPIADDCDKGTYYVARDGSIRLQSPDVTGRDVLVASSVAALRSFVAVTDDDGDEADQV